MFIANVNYGMYDHDGVANLSRIIFYRHEIPTGYSGLPKSFSQIILNVQTIYSKKERVFIWPRMGPMFIDWVMNVNIRPHRGRINLANHIGYKYKIPSGLKDNNNGKAKIINSTRIRSYLYKNQKYAMTQIWSKNHSNQTPPMTQMGPRFIANVNYGMCDPNGVEYHSSPYFL